MFNIDPLTVLGSEPADWHIRVAAARVIEADLRKQAEKRG